MRHVQQHLPTVDGELVEDSGEYVTDKPQPTRNSFRAPGNSETKEATKNNEEVLVEKEKQAPARRFFKNFLQKRPQKSPAPTKREIERQELLAQPPSILIPPAPVHGKVRTPRPTNRNRGDLGQDPATEVQRQSVPSPQPQEQPMRNNAIDLSLTHSTIPEDQVLDSTEPAVVMSRTEEEIHQEDNVVEQILEVFPDADRRQTYRLVREGHSVRNVLSNLCHARRQPCDAGRYSTGTDATMDTSSESATREIDKMISMLLEAFPDVDVDRSYAMLQEKSLNSVMTALAEESLNQVDGETSSSSIQSVQEAFPDVDRETVKTLLRHNSVTTVMMQLLDKSSDTEGQEAQAQDDTAERDPARVTERPRSRSSMLRQIREAFPDMDDQMVEGLLR
jgi:hypothetical protein